MPPDVRPPPAPLDGSPAPLTLPQVSRGRVDALVPRSAPAMAEDGVAEDGAAVHLAA